MWRGMGGVEERDGRGGGGDGRAGGGWEGWRRGEKEMRNNNNTQIAAIALQPSTTHPQL